MCGSVCNSSPYHSVRLRTSVRVPVTPPRTFSRLLAVLFAEAFTSGYPNKCGPLSVFTHFHAGANERRLPDAQGHGLHALDHGVLHTRRPCAGGRTPADSAWPGLRQMPTARPLRPGSSHSPCRSGFTLISRFSLDPKGADLVVWTAGLFAAPHARRRSSPCHSMCGAAGSSVPWRI